MIHFAANISQIFQELPVRERFKRVAEAGFTAYELLFPQRVDAEELIDLQERFGLRLALFNLEVHPDHPRGLLLAPDEKLFFARLQEAIALCGRLGCDRLHAMVGLTRPDLCHRAQIDLIVERLRRAAQPAAEAGIALFIEALNTRDNPGFFLNTSKVGIEIVRAIDRPNVRFQYDVYHMQIMEGNLCETIRKNIGAIGHVQIADVPGRHEPGTGEINYHFVLRCLADAGYEGYVGLEYTPSSPLVDPFAWMRDVGLVAPYRLE